ncbi:hypothetical protein GCM10007036_14610 [Alsobacter metallidurans]|uniref:Uncharacterized protein n=1 Tax=Alsobacter metallidurans TaxID=340221 RepID=A0A917MH64_9HYPH|nr:hypothetical protein [Alsobacter metallidurans]GGH14954.1 hypothetical protein GCM10007036_14610 [Alsobacter metallidurans]
MQPEKLHVVTVIHNPLGFKSRERLYWPFAQHMIQSGVQLTTVECVTGDEGHKLGRVAGINHVPVKCSSQVWIKENLLNIGLARLPSDWKYVAWIDADVHFRDRNWATRTLHALQHYPIVQPWTQALDLGPGGEVMQLHTSFAKVFHENPDRIVPGQGYGAPYPHPGYAWAATRDAIERLGGLIETAALGSADHHMAHAIAGRVAGTVPKGLGPGYLRPLLQWEKRAQQHINGALGCVQGVIEHGFHGTKGNRKYVERWDILKRHAFDPDTDLKRNVHGVIELAGNKPGLRRDIQHYFAARNEDANTL